MHKVVHQALWIRPDHASEGAMWRGLQSKNQGAEIDANGAHQVGTFEVEKLLEVIPSTC